MNIKLAIFAILFFVCDFAFCQTYSTSKVEKEYSNAILVLNILAKPVDIQVDLDQRYYWYSEKTGDQSTIGGYSGHLLHGMKEVFNNDRKLTSQTNYYLGIKHGEQKYWNDEGQMQRVEYVNKGKCTKAVWYTSPDENDKWKKTDYFVVWEYKPIPLSDIKDENEKKHILSFPSPDESCLCVGFPGCTEKIFSYKSQFPVSEINWLTGRRDIEKNYFEFSQKVRERESNTIGH